MGIFDFSKKKKYYFNVLIYYFYNSPIDLGLIKSNILTEILHVFM